ncbi:hypothetical protein DFS34DRAFT_691808 [Phlyctochytrium arcticum]|nr:hypothetical protein DFS34DRAFT_691808 [Phlyctochytrium arcticum]
MIPGGGPSGCYNAPVTKALILSLGFNTIIASLRNVRHRYVVWFPHVLSSHQIWRLAIPQSHYASTSALLLGSALIYHLRRTERAWSSRKFAAFTTWCAVSSTILHFLLSLVAKTVLGGMHVGSNARPWWARAPVGPWGVIFGGLWVGRNVSGKSVGIAAILGSQLLLTAPPESIAAALSGIIAAALYEANVLNVQSWRYPQWIANLASKAFSPLAAKQPPEKLAATTVDEQMRERAEHAARSIRERELRARVGVTGGIPRAPPPPPQSGAMPTGRSRQAAVLPSPPPPEEMIAQLEAMGFERDRILAVLRNTNNDVQRAAAALLE